MGARFTELVIDCKDPGRVAEFWAAVLGYDVVDRGPNGEIEIGHGTKGDGSAAPTLVFVPVPEGKTVKNRIHIDVNPTETDQSNELRRLIRLGARRVDVGQSQDVSWIVLADVEDNEFCLLRRRVEDFFLTNWPLPLGEADQGVEHDAAEKPRDAARRSGRRAWSRHPHGQSRHPPRLRAEAGA